MTPFTWFILDFVSGSTLIGIIVGLALYSVKRETPTSCPDEVEPSPAAERGIPFEAD